MTARTLNHRRPRHHAAAALTFAVCAALSVTVRAHDPGLSALEVRVGLEAIRVSLSMAPPDATAAAVDPRSFALNAIELRVDGHRLEGKVDGVAVDDNAVRIQLSYARLVGTRLEVASTVPRRLARGHRQLVSVRSLDGSLLAEHMLDGRAPGISVDLQRSAGAAGGAMAFFSLGLRHILSGYDHLLFLAGLWLAGRSAREMAMTATAFTAGHSLTLACAVLGFVTPPARLIEPLIAASIVYVGVENILQRHVASRWTVALAFGLVHGFGFAGALQDLGLGTGGASIGVPLGLFNLGVETGQIAVALAMWLLLVRLRTRPALSTALRAAGAWGVALAGSYWLVERTILHHG